MITEKQMNKSLFNAAYHMLEAARHLSNVEAFSPEARLLMVMADKFSELVNPEVSKVTEDKMLNILDEIAAAGNKETV